MAIARSLYDHGKNLQNLAKILQGRAGFTSGQDGKILVRSYRKVGKHGITES